MQTKKVCHSEYYLGLTVAYIQIKNNELEIDIGVTHSLKRLNNNQSHIDEGYIKVDIFDKSFFPFLKKLHYTYSIHSPLIIQLMQTFIEEGNMAGKGLIFSI